MTAKTLPLHNTPIMVQSNSNTIIPLPSSKNVYSCERKWTTNSKGIQKKSAKRLPLYYSAIKRQIIVILLFWIIQQNTCIVEIANT